MNISLIRYYSSKPVQHNLKMDLDPWFLTGFVDAEGNFSLGISRNKDCKTGWNIRIFFWIVLHKRDVELLEWVQNYFGL